LAIFTQVALTRSTAFLEAKFTPLHGQVARLAQLPAQEQKRHFQAFQEAGRWPTVPRPAKRTLPLDAEPAALGRTLWDQLGPHQAGLIYHHLAALIRG